MNISSIRPSVFSSINEKKSVNELKIIKPELKTNNNLLNNSLPELLGRYQVSFNGTNKIRNGIFQHDCSEVFGANEHIEYNKEDGSFVHTISNRDGSLIKKEEFFPLEQKEIITRVSEDKTEICTTVKNIGDRREILDYDGKQVYLRLYDAKTGNIKTVETDYDRKREVTVDIINGQKNVQVVDLLTGQRVFSGELVEDRQFDKKTNTFITKNIITDQTLREEKYTYGGDILSLVEYFENSGNIARRFYLDSKSGKYRDTYYSNNGVREMTRVISKDKTEEIIVQYYSDGKTERSKTENVYDKNGNITGRTIYTPRTSIIEKYFDYGENEVTEYFYKKQPNVAIKAIIHDGNTKLGEIFYYENNGLIASENVYNKDGSYTEYIYTPNGDTSEINLYDSQKNCYSSTEYNTATGKKLRFTEVDPITQEVKDIQYDRKTGLIRVISIISSDKNIKEKTVFYSDGHTPKMKFEYNRDKSYTKTLYNEFGQPISKGEFNADDSPKVTKNNNKSGNNANNLSQEEFLNELSSVVGHIREKRPTDKQLARFAEIIEIDNPEQIKYMDKSTYRKLAMKYRETNKVIFQIINNLYHAEYNYKQGK